MSSVEPLRPVRLAGAAQGFNWLPVFIADEQGLFDRRGLAVEYLRLGSVEKATLAVKEGTADLAITPPEGAVIDYLGGGSLRLIAINSQRLPMSMVSRPGIGALADLQGARIGTSSLTEGTAVYTTRMLATVGLNYPDDYSFVLAGVHTTRWDALRAGGIDAAPQPAPWNLLARREGFSDLGDIAQILPEIIFAAIVADLSWINSNAETASRLIDALAEAHEIVNDPAQDATTLPVYERITVPGDPELARAGFEYTRDLGMWPAGLRVSPNAFATNLEVMEGAGLITADQRTAAAGSIDDRFLQTKGGEPDGPR